MSTNYHQLLQHFEETSLDEISKASLFSRVEIKYVLPLQLVAAFLGNFRHDFKILTVEGHKQQPYYTRYFDTAGFSLYLRHHNGKHNRVKIRSRLYEQSNDCFLEIKRKYNEVRSEKRRLVITCLPDTVNTAQYLELNLFEGIDTQLEQKLDNRFNRITLCDHYFTERITIDTDINWAYRGISKSLNGLAVIEIKKLRYNYIHPIVLWLRKQGIQDTSFSKYSIGTLLLYPTIKYNNFKPVLHHIEKMFPQQQF